MSHRTAAWLAWSVCALSLVLTALGSLLLLTLNFSHPNVPVYDYWHQSGATGVVFSTLGPSSPPAAPSTQSGGSSAQ
jgi:hypothetical protein